jgi:hypothetical protein
MGDYLRHFIDRFQPKLQEATVRKIASAGKAVGHNRNRY